MIEGLAAMLEEDGDRAALELSLGALFAGPSKLIRHHTFKKSVYRLTIDSRDGARTVVVKRLKCARALRNELVFARWLPAVGLGGGCAALLGRAARPDGRSLWHVYEDVGDGVLTPEAPDRDRVGAVARLVASVHSRFAEHPLLAEARLLGGDLGISFFAASTADALRGVRALLSRLGMMTPGHRALLERHLARLEHLAASVPMRTEAFRAHAGPETLLHGDLWTTNTLAVDGGRRACLIDWDHAGAGPASYDVSTFLLRFPREHRAWVLALYRDGLDGRGWRAPGVRELNVLFETAELSRYANHLCWLGLALLEGEQDWAWEGCREVEGWFEALAPVVPEPEALAGAGGRG